FVGGGATQPDAVGVADGYGHRRFVRDDSEMIKTARRAENGLVFDPLDDAETMIRVNDLVSDLKCHESPCLERAMEGRCGAGSPMSIAHSGGLGQREMAENKAFLAISPVVWASDQLA